MSFRPAIPLLIATLLWAAPLVSSPAAASWAVGDGGHLWLIEPHGDDAQTAIVYHLHEQDDPSHTVSKAADLPGRVVLHGHASRGGALWLIRDDGSIQVINAKRSTFDGRWEYTSRPARRLPDAVTPRSFAVGPEGPWVLARVESAATLALLETRTPTDARVPDTDLDQAKLNLALGLPPDFPLHPPDTPTPTPETQQDASEDPDAAKPDRQPAASVAVDRLLRQHRGRWVSHPLPDDWPGGGGQLIQQRATDPAPVLIAWPRAQQSGGVWRWDGQAWQHEEIEGLAAGVRWGAAVVDRQIVLATEPENQPGQVTLYLLREGRAHPITTLDIASPRPGRWAVAGLPLAVAVLHRTDESDESASPRSQAPLGVLMTQINLLGREVHPATPLRTRPPQPLFAQPDQVVMMTVLVVATALMFMFWRRDPKRNRLIVPDGYQLAPLIRRAMAGLIDLAPGIAVVVLVFGVEPRDLGTIWPFQPRAASWDAMTPGLTLIVLTVLHTAVGEVIAGQSIGKKLTGISVRSLTGRRATPMQIAARCLLKAFDIVAPLLLLLPIIGPFRQRLGDLVARTVLLAPKPPTPQDEQDQQEDNDQTTEDDDDA